jgi:hypothetical protein
VEVKRILIYMKCTIYFRLWYPKGEEFTLTTHTNAKWESIVDDRKSTSGGTFFLGNCLVSLLSKKQSSISLSIIEAEYIETKSCCTQILWMK